jgi:hypothetical protein
MFLLAATFSICLTILPCTKKLICERCVDGGRRELKRVTYIGHELCRVHYQDGGIEVEECLIRRRDRLPQDDAL